MMMVNMGAVIAECLPRGCMIHTWRDPREWVQVIQHGDNPEAQLRLHPHDLVMNGAERNTRYIVAWLREVHKYEDANGDSNSR